MLTSILEWVANTYLGEFVQKYGEGILVITIISVFVGWISSLIISHSTQKALAKHSEQITRRSLTFEYLLKSEFDFYDALLLQAQRINKKFEKIYDYLDDCIKNDFNNYSYSEFESLLSSFDKSVDKGHSLQFLYYNHYGYSNKRVIWAYRQFIQYMTNWTAIWSISSTQGRIRDEAQKLNEFSLEAINTHSGFLTQTIYDRIEIAVETNGRKVRHKLYRLKRQDRKAGLLIIPFSKPYRVWRKLAGFVNLKYGKNIL